jgi:hypothetical protein
MDETGVSAPEQSLAQLVRELLGSAEVHGPPVPLQVLASLCDVVEVQAVDMPKAGMLSAPRGGGFAIRVKAKEREAPDRRR